MTYSYKGEVYWTDEKGKEIKLNYAGYDKRTSVERENGRLDRDYGFELHAIRGKEKKIKTNKHKKGKARKYFIKTFIIFKKSLHRKKYIMQTC